MKTWKAPHFQKNYDDFMIFSYDEILIDLRWSYNKKDHCIMYPNETTWAYICYRKKISTQSLCHRALLLCNLIRLLAVCVTNSRRKVQNLRIKFTKWRFFSDTSRARYDALTYTMMHYTKLFKSWTYMNWKWK